MHCIDAWLQLCLRRQHQNYIGSNDSNDEQNTSVTGIEVACDDVIQTGDEGNSTSSDGNEPYPSGILEGKRQVNRLSWFNLYIMMLAFVCCGPSFTPLCVLLHSKAKQAVYRKLI